MDSSSRERQIFGNRTLNLRSIKAIGYDLDYTLVHYQVDAWEERAFAATRAGLAAQGWPVADLVFDPSKVIRGLTIDLEAGNLVKPTRFGYVIRAAHGTRFLEFDELRRSYAGTLVDLADPRFVFLNTLFTLSEASLFAQLVDLHDRGRLPGVRSYADLYRTVRSTLDTAHLEGALKAEIAAAPERFVVDDPDTALTVLDQRNAGRRMLLITNSEWTHTRRMMEYAFDPHLPGGTTWRDLFDIVIVSAGKPGFFTDTPRLFRVVDEEQSLLVPHFGDLEVGGVYFGGSAALVEERLGLGGDEILYVGDHLFADVHLSKALLRWRTALVLRELEEEIRAQEAFLPQEATLTALMLEKQDLERALATARLDRQRMRRDYAPAGDDHDGDVDAAISALRSDLESLDERIGPLAIEAGRLRNESWGPLMRSGNDKSMFARQVERYADVYTSRVSNFLEATPYGFLRAARVTLPHDPI